LFFASAVTEFDYQRTRHFSVWADELDRHQQWRVGGGMKLASRRLSRIREIGAIFFGRYQASLGGTTSQPLTAPHRARVCDGRPFGRELRTSC
jgi:hypothetical protein